MRKNKANDVDTTEEVLENEGEVQCEDLPEITMEEAAELLRDLKKQNDDYLDRLQRNMAEFDNFRKRTVKEKASMYDDGVSDTVIKLLPIVDNFERALGSVSDKEDNLYKGIDMIYKQLMDTIISLGVEHISCVGEAFDPNLHFAVLHEENDAYDENTIIEEMQKGYKYKDKVIRPAMVKVAN